MILAMITTVIGRRQVVRGLSSTKVVLENRLMNLVMLNLNGHLTVVASLRSTVKKSGESET